MVAEEGWSLTRGLDFSDLTGRNLVFGKSGRLGEVIAYERFGILEK